MDSQLVIFLKDTLGQSNERRAIAESNLESLRESDYFVNAICTELVNEANDEIVRCAAGLLLKNSLSAKEYVMKVRREQVWRELDVNFKANIKIALLGTLASPLKQVTLTVAQVITAIALIDLPNDEWPTLVDSLLQNVAVGSENVSLKESTLNTIGYVCEALELEDVISLDQPQASKILTAVCQGAHPNEKNTAVRLAALKALSNSIAFIKANFEVE
ncbi:hypothetical protein HK096_009022, partial [Nowakowskiella sp. JEL0078]